MKHSRSISLLTPLQRLPLRREESQMAADLQKQVQDAIDPASSVACRSRCTAAVSRWSMPSRGWPSKTSARAIARMYAALLGDLDDVPLLTEERLREATTLSMSGTDAVFGMPSAWALGYAIGRPGSSPEDAPTAFGVGGAGGSFAYGDSASGIAFGLTKNRLTNDFNSVTEIIQIVTEATGR